MASGTLQIRLDSTERVKARLDELSALLEQAPESAKDVLLGLFDGLTLDFRERRLPSTSVASDHVVVFDVSLSGIDELLAAARSAVQGNGIDHGKPPRA